MKQLFVAWTPFMRRPESMQPFFGYRLCFIRTYFGKKWLKPFEYAVKTVLTFALLLRRRPDVLWVQLAPTFLLYIAFVYKGLFRRKMKIVADCHNSMYRRPWIALPGAVALLNRCDRVLVHNGKMRIKAEEAGVRKERLSVLETKPATVKNAVSAAGRYRRPWVLFPCSFDSDEPVDEVIAAARLVPHLTFVVTGNPAKYKGAHRLSELPANLHMAGFLPKDEYNGLLTDCDFVLGLTTQDDVQLSVANEAVGVGKPLVISGTPLLRQLFYRGALYVNPLDPRSIADGCLEMLERRDELAADVARLLRERNERWLAQAREVHGSVLDSGQFRGGKEVLL